MFKIMRPLLLLTLLITAVLVCSPAALAAISSVEIENNYAATDYVTVTLDAPIITNTAFWLFLLNGPSDTSAQIGSFTIRKGAISGKISVAAGKLSDFKGGSLLVRAATGDEYEADYDPADETVLVDPDRYVKLRNNPTGVETLIIDGEIVVKGMTAMAVVNGRLYKATANKDGVDLAVSLSSSMEVGTPVWYTIAQPGCRDMGYRELTLGEVETTDDPVSPSLAFQTGSATNSQLLVKGVEPNTTVIYTYQDVATNKIVTKKTMVLLGTTVVPVNGLNLIAGSEISVSLMEKGKLESGSVKLTVPSTKATTMLKAGAVKVENEHDTVADTTSATVTVSAMVGYTVRIYDKDGLPLGTPVTVPDPGTGASSSTVELVVAGLGPAATCIYASVEDGTSPESGWLKVAVKAAKKITPAP